MTEKKCAAKNRYNNDCKNYSTGEEIYCNYHLYLKEYSSEQLNNLSLCCGCFMWKFINNNTSRCDKCLSISGKNNKEVTEKRNLKHKCENPEKPCDNQVDENGKYCKKHKKRCDIDTLNLTLKENESICSNYLSRNSNDDPTLKTKKCSGIAEIGRSKCRNCLDVDNAKDKKRAMERAKNNTDTEKCCAGPCGKLRDIKSFINESDIECSQCKKCRDGYKIMNEREIKRAIEKNVKVCNNADVIDENKSNDNLNENNDDTDNSTNDSNDDNIIDENNNENKNDTNNSNNDKNNKKLIDELCDKNNAQWNLYNTTHDESILITCTRCLVENVVADHINEKNKRCKYCSSCRKHDRDRGRDRTEYRKKQRENGNVAKYSREHRKRLKEKIGLTAFLKRNSDGAFLWRSNNRDKVLAGYERDKNNVNIKIKDVRFSAKYREIEMELTNENIIELVQNSCFYCKFKNEKYLNGIDRIRNEIHYKYENCVPCCQLCNFLKGELDYQNFMKIIMHILTINKKIDGNLYPEAFENKKTKPMYNSYLKRAGQKELEFQISKEEFDEMVKQPCYMCKKKTNKFHWNGIDRYDNNIGYTISNCRPCCKICNYLKNNYNFDDVINKLLEIYNYHTRDVFMCNEYAKYYSSDKKKRILNDKIKTLSVYGVYNPRNKDLLDLMSEDEIKELNEKLEKEEEIKKQEEAKILEEQKKRDEENKRNNRSNSYGNNNNANKRNNNYNNENYTNNDNDKYNNNNNGNNRNNNNRNNRNNNYNDKNYTNNDNDKSNNRNNRSNNYGDNNNNNGNNRNNNYNDKNCTNNGNNKYNNRNNRDNNYNKINYTSNRNENYNNYNNKNNTNNGNNKYNTRNNRSNNYDNENNNQYNENNPDNYENTLRFQLGHTSTPNVTREENTYNDCPLLETFGKRKVVTPKIPTKKATIEQKKKKRELERRIQNMRKFGDDCDKLEVELEELLYEYIFN